MQAGMELRELNRRFPVRSDEEDHSEDEILARRIRRDLEQQQELPRACVVTLACGLCLLLGAWLRTGGL